MATEHKQFAESEDTEQLSPEKKEICLRAQAEWQENCSEDEDPSVYYLEGKSSFVVFRAPRREEYKRLKTIFVNDKSHVNTRADADSRLAQDCILYPTGNELMSLLKRRAGLDSRVAASILELGSDSELKEAKKFNADTKS